MKRTLAIAMLLLAGCSTSPRRYSAPNHTALVEATQRLSSSVAQAHVAASRARASLAQVDLAAKREKARIEVLPPKLTELLRIAPLELRPEIEAIQADVIELQGAHAATESQIAETHRAQSVLAEELEKANAAKNEQQQQQTAFVAEADSLALKATEENAARIKAEKSLSWYRWHWWGSWIALGLGVLVSGIFAFLKMTGRLAVVAAGVAGKLP